MNEQEELISLMKEYRGAVDMERRAKAIKDNVKDRGVPLMMALGIKSFKTEGVGTMVVKDGVSRSISGDKLRASLLLVLPVDKVVEIMESCTTTTTYTTLQVTFEKKKTEAPNEQK